MMRKISRLFVIKNRFEACAIIYALALGAAERGKHYLDTFPGFGGRMLFVAAMVAVWMGGAKILDALSYERKPAVWTGPDRRTVSVRPDNPGAQACRET
jgi:hypothetical protein